MSSDNAILSDSADTPKRRVIILGASNVTLSFPLLFKSLNASLPGSFEFFAAHGHGRSFCQWSYVLHRGLPSILECGLWPAIQSQPPIDQTWGLITDIGNDLIYGLSVEQVLRQVQTAFERLHALGASLTFVRPPLERVLLLSERRYRIIKQLFFPGPTVPWSDLSQRIVELDDRASEVARLYDAKMITPRLEWYGLDPIHIRQTLRVRIWREILESWSFDLPVVMRRPGPNDLTRIWRMAPAERTYWKKPTLTPQPIWKDPEGMTLWQF